MGFQSAHPADRVAAANGSNYSEYAREGSGSPPPATDESSTASPDPTLGDGASDKSCANEQEPFNLKSQSLRQRTAQACDKCRERKTKCSGHRPVCTRCTNRGLLCEYTIRESRTRSILRPRPVSSPNPFQVNYRSGGGMPTPAYHSRMGASQISAYDRSPSGYIMLTPNSPMAPPMEAYIPPSSSFNDQLNGIESPYARPPPQKRHPLMSQELQGWSDVPPTVPSQAPMNGFSERQIPSKEKQQLYSYDYMGRSQAADAELSSSALVAVEESAVQHETRSDMVLHADSVYNHDGTFASFSSPSPDETDFSSGPNSASLRPPSVPGRLFNGMEAYNYLEDVASLGFRPGNAYAAWGVPPQQIQEISGFSPEYVAAIANYTSSFSTFEDKSGMSPPIACPPPSSQSIGRGGYSTHRVQRPSYPGAQAHAQGAYAAELPDRVQNSGLYDLQMPPDAAPEGLHPFSAPTVSDPGNRFEGYKFFK